MSKIKQLAVDLVEYEDEIAELLRRVKVATPSAYEIILRDDVSDTTKRGYLHNFTNDKELVTLVLFSLELKNN